jgi:hypothetical protein
MGWVRAGVAEHARRTTGSCDSRLLFVSTQSERQNNPDFAGLRNRKIRYDREKRWIQSTQLEGPSGRRRRRGAKQLNEGTGIKMTIDESNASEQAA